MTRVFQKYKDEYKEEARKRILDAALEVVKKKGYQSITLDDIAGEVGVTKGTLYLYFKNKEDLFKNVFHEMSKSFRETMDYHLADSDCLESALSCMIDEIIAVNKEFGIENNLAMISEWFAVAVRDPSARPRFKEMLTCGRKSFEERVLLLQKRKVVPETVDVEAATKGIMALIVAIKIMMFLGEDEIEIKKWWISSVKKLLDIPTTEMS
jgi:AcrR family transcriptional regulator